MTKDVKKKIDEIIKKYGKLPELAPIDIQKINPDDDIKPFELEENKE